MKALAAIALLLVVLPASAAPTHPSIEVGAEPFGIAFAGGAAWTADYGNGRVHRIDPRT